jgi:hypothetical protein
VVSLAEPVAGGRASKGRFIYCFSFLLNLVLASFGPIFYLLNVLSFLAQEERTKEKGLWGLIFVGYAAPQK